MSAVDLAATADADGLPPRARRREQVRQRLLSAAIDLFTEQGFKATTMDAIAERADVARQTVFNYFPEKVAFLAEWGRQRRLHVARISEAGRQLDRSASSRLHGYLREMAALNVASREQTVVLMDASARYGALMADTSLAAALAALVDDGQRDGEFRSDVPPDQGGALLANVYVSTVLRWIADEPPPFDLSDRLDGMLGIILRGLAP